MKSKIDIIGGIVGAIVLNIAHELAKKTITDAPRIDDIGNEGIVKGAEAVGVTPPSGKALDSTTFAFNIFTNAMSYRIIGKYDRQHLLIRGALHGLAIGLGTLSLSKAIDVDDRPVTRTLLTKVLTVSWYILGGIAAAATIKCLRKEE